MANNIVCRHCRAQLFSYTPEGLCPACGARAAEAVEKKGKAFGHRTAEHNRFYTHYSLTEQLFEKESFVESGTVLEPACGACHMAYPLSMRFKNLEIYDINNEEFYGDFFRETRKFDYLITNPPYGKMTDGFVEKAKEVTRHKFALLVRTNYLSGTGRFNAGIFKGLRNVYVFTRMPDFKAHIRDDGKYPTAMIVYAWMVWEIGYNGPILTSHIDNQRFVLKKDEKDS